MTTCSRSGLGSSGIVVGESVRCQVRVTDGPDQSALAVDNRDAPVEACPEHNVRNLEGRPRVDDDRVRRHDVRDRSSCGGHSKPASEDHHPRQRADGDRANWPEVQAARTEKCAQLV